MVFSPQTGPESILRSRIRYEGTDAEETGEGRHPTPALKKKKCIWAVSRDVTSSVGSLPLVDRILHFLPTDPVHTVRFGVQSWFMISPLIGTVFQKLPSCFYRLSLMMKPQVVFVLGGPGAGKGTQCSKIVEVRRMGRERTVKSVTFDGYDLTVIGVYNIMIRRMLILLNLSLNIPLFNTLMSVTLRLPVVL